MRKIIETKLVWDFTAPGMELSKLGGMKVKRVEGQAHNIFDEMGLELTISDVRASGIKNAVWWLHDQLEIIAALLRIPSRSFRLGMVGKDEFEYRYILRRTTENATITIYKTFVAVFEELGCDGRLWTDNHIFPEVTQATFWQRGNSPTDRWISQGERLARSALT